VQSAAGNRRALAAGHTALALALALAVIGCGSGAAHTNGGGGPPASGAAVMALSFADAKFAGPATIAGGPVTLRFANHGKAPHSAQLLRLLGGHTIAQALAALGSRSTGTPVWIRAEGGLGAVLPGASASASMILPAGSYAVLDLTGAQEGQVGSPVAMALTVTAARTGALPSTATTITAAAPSKGHYRWEISGPLTVGTHAVRFVSQGAAAVHELTAVRVIGSTSVAQIAQALEANGPPPTFIDRATKQQTAVLDGGSSLTTELTFTRPGTYVFFCHLADRGGGKPHFAQGLITTVTVH
jgi:plastocyanin